jgi:hypothetical protein
MGKVLNMKKIVLLLFMNAVISASCASTPQTPASSVTSVPFQPTAAQAPQLIDLKNGGFSLAIHSDLEFDTDDYSVNISDKGGELIISLNGKPYIASLYTLESFLDRYLAEMAARGGSFHESDPYEINIDGMSGIAIDLTGNFLNDPMAGKAVAISPGKDFIIFGLGMSNQGTHKNGWMESGSPIFEAIIASIKFKEEVKQ